MPPETKYCPHLHPLARIRRTLDRDAQEFSNFCQAQIQYPQLQDDTQFTRAFRERAKRVHQGQEAYHAELTRSLEREAIIALTQDGQKITLDELAQKEGILACSVCHHELDKPSYPDFN